MLLPYEVPRGWQTSVSVRDLQRAVWDRRIARVQGFFARAGARLDRFQARAQFGRSSTQWRGAREHVRRTKEVFRGRVADAQRRIGDASRRIHTPHGRLTRLGRFAGPIGVGTSAYTAVEGSPYDGARGTIDRSVAGATAVAGATLLAASLTTVAVAPVILTVAGVAVVAGTAWVVGNLAYDAWQNRKEIARRVSDGFGGADTAVNLAASRLGSLVGIGS